MSRETSKEIASLAGQVLAADYYDLCYDVAKLEEFFDTAQRLAGSCLVQYEQETE